MWQTPQAIKSDIHTIHYDEIVQENYIIATTSLNAVLKIEEIFLK